MPIIPLGWKTGHFPACWSFTFEEANLPVSIPTGSTCLFQSSAAQIAVQTRIPCVCREEDDGMIRDSQRTDANTRHLRGDPLTLQPSPVPHPI